MAYAAGPFLEVGNCVTSGSGADLSRGLDLNQRPSSYETAVQCRKSLNFFTCSKNGSHPRLDGSLPLPASMEPPSPSPNEGRGAMEKQAAALMVSQRCYPRMLGGQRLGRSGSLLPQNFIHRSSLRQLVN